MPSSASYAEKTITWPTGGGKLDFDYYVDSEEGADQLKFMVDGTPTYAWSGASKAGHITQSLTGGPHVIRFEYVKDAANDRGLDTAFVDAIVARDNVGIFRRFYFEDRVASTQGWSVGGSGGGFAANPFGYERALRRPISQAFSGYIPNPTSSRAERSFTFSGTGPHQLAFDYSVDSEPNFDFLRVYVDGTPVWSISGNANGTKVLDMSVGTHTVMFEYAKDTNIDVGRDFALIDNVRAVSNNAPFERHSFDGRPLGALPYGWVASGYNATGFVLAQGIRWQYRSEGRPVQQDVGHNLVLDARGPGHLAAGGARTRRASFVIAGQGEADRDPSTIDRADQFSLRSCRNRRDIAIAIWTQADVGALMSSRRASWIVVATCVAACNIAEDSRPGMVTSHGEALTGSTGNGFAPYDDTTAQRNASVILNAGCSATVISPRFVLTAIHCFAGGWSGDTDPYWYDPSLVAGLRQTPTWPLPTAKGAWRRTALVGNAAMGKFDLALLTTTARITLAGDSITPVHPSEPTIPCPSSVFASVYTGVGGDSVLVRRKGTGEANCTNNSSAWGTTPGLEGTCVKWSAPWGQEGDSGHRR